ncbi:SMI1/KNR4 family protein [Jeotgalibacillus proteolyticus]|uniref:SMI1/KNR4 family protein n=1 Tax=Jeotgalibacillus proteolyticus TaxID=2082395 RepID=A0A2S5GBH1_9BACL|nr:SMI1/KNR4 family protein [Jeotgalibacillus proteolyticus]PPA70346.1 SMI1/KNR4 family protein [Jeotgalibacillus proteolyticus]
MKKAIHRINPSSKATGVSELQLKKTEKELGAVFPEEYKELFLETNGAAFDEWILYPIQPIEQGRLSKDIVKMNKEKRPENLPDDMICIGEKTNGDKLCYRIRRRLMQEQIYVYYEKTEKCDCKSSDLKSFIDWFVPKVDTTKPNNIGVFKIESGNLVVADPYYLEDDESEGKISISNVKNGEWTASLSYLPDETIKSLTVYYGDKKSSGRWHACEKMIAVDSASAGVFDPSLSVQIKDDEYIEITSSDVQGGIVPGGAISVSGYGDGLYEVNVKYNRSKEVVGVMIGFEEDY